MKVAVTGGIGSGKSTLCAMLSEMGYPVFSCDEIVRELYRDPVFCSRVTEATGVPFDGGADARKALAAAVFGCPERLRALESLVHPAAIARAAELAEGKELSFTEVPVLFESGSENKFDRVVVVMRDKSARVRAAAERDGARVEDILARVKNQTDYENLPQKAHTVLVNDGSLADLRRKAVALIEELKRG